jgi:FMN phosphatase YigB (HAD superfamily)
VPTFKVVFFNMGGTLLQLRNTTLPRLYSEHLTKITQKKITPEQVFLAFRKADTWMQTRKSDHYLFSDMDQRKYQNAFYTELGFNGRQQINRIETELSDLIEFEFELEKGAEETLRLLKKNYGLGLISNWDVDGYDILESFGIKNLFDSITFSGEFGVSKPSREIFKSGLADFPESRAKNAVYIGDDYEQDIVPAQKIRMFTVLFDKGPTGMHGFPKRTDVKCPRVESLTKLPKLMAQYERKK